MKFLKILAGSFLIFLGFFSSACVDSARLPLPQDPVLAWNLHQKFLETQQNWTVTGKAGLSDGVHAEVVDFVWQQQNQEYHIDFYGPLNIKFASLIKDKSGLFLKTQSDKIFALDPEHLMQQELGFSLPIDGLQHWIIGCPQGKAAKWTLNKFAYLDTLKEGDWDIRYEDYQPVKGRAFPHQILLKNGRFKAVLRIQKIIVVQSPF